jgi:hypothetical protein
MLVALIHWGSVTDISFLGAKIALNRVDMLILMPIVIALIYILIDHKLLRIAEVYRQINKTAEKLLFLNQEAKPVTIREIHLYGAGVTGLILSLSRWQVKRLLINNPFKFEFRPKHPTKQEKERLSSNILKWWKPESHNESSEKTAELGWKLGYLIERISWILSIFNWLITVIVLTLITALLFLLPIIVVGYYEYIDYFFNKPITFGWPLFSLLVLILIAIYTIFCVILLITTYSVDLIESLKKDLRESRYESMLKKILTYFSH